MRFEGQIALVTGGRSGIGQAIARRLEAEGARVFSAQRTEDAEREFITADLADPEVSQKIIKEVTAKTQRLDILVNNSGVMQEALVEDMTLQDWSQTLAVNLTAPFMMIKAALPWLRKTKGAIVNIGSVEGLGSNPTHAAYCASKAGLHGLTRAVAVDHGHEGIRCNAVAPGWIETELNADYVADKPNPQAFREGLAGIHPVGHTGTPEDVAQLVAFLAAPENRFITGEIYRVDGGRMSKLSLP